MRRSLHWSLLALAFAGCRDDTAPVDAAPGDTSTIPTAADLLAKLATCDPVVGGPFATDGGGTADVSICGYAGAVFWKADLDVDCDGVETAQCNLTTDPAFQAQTAATDSNGDFLDAAALPFVVVPGISSRFDFAAAGLEMGSVVAVIYQDHVEYGPLGDIGPTAIIGEASYAMAAALGIDPDPSTGGVESGVAYIAFPSTTVAPIESHDAAVQLGIARARDLLMHIH